uniref:Uncharacterized protein n=1 Tax=Sphaerodactylus townsendi TaxID=933632 RepID=A0ACB8G4U7_9SAUR
MSQFQKRERIQSKEKSHFQLEEGSEQNRRQVGFLQLFQLSNFFEEAGNLMQPTSAIPCSPLFSQLAFLLYRCFSVARIASIICMQTISEGHKGSLKKQHFSHSFVGNCSCCSLSVAATSFFFTI